MHVPYISGRHEETAFFSEIEQIEKLFADGDLLYVTYNNQRIAGVLLDYQNEMATLRYIGVLNNNADYLKKGCIGATYYFAIKHAIAQGYNRFNFGGSSPFLNDGLTYFKLSFKPFIMENTYLEDHYVRMMFPAKTSAFVPFTLNNGFIYEQRNREWNRLIFVEPEEFRDLKRIRSRLKSLQCKGIHRTEFCTVGGDQAASEIAALLRSDEAQGLPEEFRDSAVITLSLSTAGSED
jgi:hypothetical protein